MKTENVYAFPISLRIFSKYRNFSKGVPTHRIYLGKGEYKGKIYDESNAVDFGAPVGTNVFCAYSGKVVKVFNKTEKNWKDIWSAPPEGYFSDTSEQYGNHVIVQSGNEFSWYCHLKFNSIVVSEGQEVKKGDLVGKVGRTGISLKPHLHFQVTIPREKWLRHGYYTPEIRWEDEESAKRYIQRFSIKK